MVAAWLAGRIVPLAAMLGSPGHRSLGMHGQPYTTIMVRPARESARLVAALAAFAALGACRDVVVERPELPAGAVPLTAPARYREWWADAKRCSGLGGEYERLRWFVVPGTVSFEYQGGRYDGVWWSDYHWIVLSEARVHDSLVVRHEMLHDLVGRGDHPPEFFEEKCGGVVSCGAGCARLGGGSARVVAD